MGKGAPDYTRVTEIRGQDPTGELVTLAVDANGQLYAVIKGTDGVTLRTIAVDASGRIIMVPYGAVEVTGDVDVTQTDKTREIQGKEGTTLRTIAVDASGRIIMVPYGVTSISGTATVTQAEKDREVQGKDGVTLRTLAVDASGQLIMVPRGQSGNYMSVDASGFMTSVMKGVDGVTLRTVAVDSTGKILGVLQGDYAGSLKTLAVDSQGRMLAVLTDPEDVFGNPHYMGAAELAVRLGSISFFERRGQVLLMENFCEGLGRWAYERGAGYELLPLSSTQTRTGQYSAQLVTPTGSPYVAWIWHPEPYPTLSKMGLEVTFRAIAGVDYFRIGLYRRNTTSQTRFILEVDPVDLKWRYMNSAADFTDISAIPDPTDAINRFDHLKLVVDLTTLKYVRALYNDLSADLSAQAGNPVAVAVPKDVFIIVSVASPNATVRGAFVDSVIITQNES